MLREFHDELEYDLRIHCGVRLRDFWTGDLSPRELAVLIRFLPASSEFRKAATPDEAHVARYGPTEYLLMELFDLTAMASPYIKQGRPYPRPWEQIEARQKAERRAAALEAQAARVREQRRRREIEGVTSDG